ncbi:hypothetical protein VTK26DRAFT_4321 [Humicola hyalothermophila]
MILTIAASTTCDRVWSFFRSVSLLSSSPSTLDALLTTGALILMVLLTNWALNANLSDGLTVLDMGSLASTRDRGGMDSEPSVRTRSGVGMLVLAWISSKPRLSPSARSLNSSSTTMPYVDTLSSYRRSLLSGPVSLPGALGKTHLMSALPADPTHVSTRPVRSLR